METGYARLCAAFVGARALIRGTVDLDDFRPEARADAASLALARRFAMELDGNPDPNALGPVTVTAVLRDGSRREARVERMYGSPANPLTRDAHLAKLRRNWASGARPLDPADAEALIRLIDDLETVPDSREILRLARAPA
jgi:2-methylcitrate dehydratase PrpD